VALLLSAIAAIFWHTEFVYSLPTPVPENYHPVVLGNKIRVPESLRLNGSSGPLFLHFFNPGCPCSRFNMAYFRSLQKKYGSKVGFAIVVMSNKNYTAEEIQRKFNVTIPVLFDTSLARICGVYSTPQAVIIDENNKLFYRGNYNRSRYCTDSRSNYAQQALESLLQHSPVVFGRYATTAYGCSLPNCSK
jgi:hypothetical protein